ncbi:AraC family transcriptional regulator [Kineosporia sp. NBRC 101677]|uniref:helix-turn-helix domain-containing protein n=1 Tax=Kineosporia sp. NBRC 101677 TaxID=3032197 RepID=UPI0024A417BF|nr:AraC family transcriptional regulator [Kineosporia sp. NBRC 101677]GLY19657.1 AraC family transcriptional regulator [Kineosporia sp. NBRC 101677]
MTRPGLPSRIVRSSSRLGWTAVRLDEYEDPFVAEPFATRSPSLTLVRVSSGRYRIASRNGRRWTSDDYRPGSIGITAPGKENVLRWQATAPARMRSQHLHLAPSLVPAGVTFPDALTLDDAYVQASLQTLVSALDDEAPAVYADSVAAALAAHVVYRVAPTSLPRSRPGRATLSAGEVDLVVEFMHAHLADDISLEQLAELLGLSKFHFLRVFRGATGHTPARYLGRLRLRQGARLLRNSDRPVAAIAASCGYRSPGQFAAAFRREYGCTPRAYRARPGR